MIKIAFQTKSPLCQIDKTEDATSIRNSIIRVKKQKVFIRNKHGARMPLSVPIYTGNGFRGMLRRETMAVMLEALAKNVKDDEKLLGSPEDYHLMNSGGGNLYQEQSFDIEDEVRRLNPQISLFGASLAIKGKIRVSNFIPFEKNLDDEVYYQFYESEKGNVFSSILANTTVVVRDGILDRDKNSQYLTQEQIQEWLEKSDANIKARAKDRNSEEEEEDDKKTKTKKQTIRGVIDREYVAVGIDFFGGISEREKLTEVEKGLLILGLEKAILNNLGSTSANDFGKVEYKITIDEDSSIITEVNEYGACTISKRNYSKEMKKCIEETKDFLSNISKENFEMTNILMKKT